MSPSTEFWDSRYRAGQTPWDFGGVPEAIRRFLADTGRLVGFFLYGHEAEPPPYPLTEADAQSLFAGKFMRTADEPVTDSLPIFAGRERWQIWQKNAPAR